MSNSNQSINPSFNNSIDPIHDPPPISPPPQPPPAPHSSSLAMTKRISPGPLTIDKSIPNNPTSSQKNSTRPIPAFLTKLYTMVNDPSTDHLIKWNQTNGDSFFVVSSERFGRELLPKYFKHSNFGSFVRQLNMYGFHKVPHLNQGVLQGEIPETEMLEFTNLNFQRGQPDLLSLIQRKKPCPDPNNPSTTESAENGPSNPPISQHSNNADLQAVLADISSIRSRQSIINSDLKTLQSSNAHLWKEAIANRDRNKRCQDTINKILGFLAQVFAGKVSSLKDPPTGNSTSNTKTGVNLNRASTDDHHPMDVLLSQEDNIPELDRLRSLTKNSRDQHHRSHSNNFSYHHQSSPSNSALSLYSKMRHPRLMLEDTQRPSKSPTFRHSSNLTSSPNLPHKVSNFDEIPPFNQTGLSHGVALNDQDPKPCHGLNPPTPSAHDSSPSDSSAGSSQHPGIRDSSIDPSLEINSDPTAADAQTNLNHDSAHGYHQPNPDSVLQALFNDNHSNGGFNFNDNILSGFNWADILTASELGGFEESNKTPTAQNSAPLLTITDGQSPQPIDQPSSSLVNVNTNQLLTATQNQANSLEDTTNKVESLEAAIKRLVGSLPETLDNPAPLNLALEEIDKGQQSVNPFEVSHDLGPEPDPEAQRNIAADAFMRTLNEIPSRSISTKELTTEPARSQAQEPIEPLDLDKLLDEWTYEDTVRLPSGLTPSVSPAPTSRVQRIETDSRALNNLRDYFEESSNGIDSSTSLGPSGSRSAIEPGLVFDLADDNHLRRIMCRKKSGAGEGLTKDDPRNRNGSNVAMATNFESSAASSPSLLNMPAIRLPHNNNNNNTMISNLSGPMGSVSSSGLSSDPPVLKTMEMLKKNDRHPQLIKRRIDEGPESSNSIPLESPAGLKNGFYGHSSNNPSSLSSSSPGFQHKKTRL